MSIRKEKYTITEAHDIQQHTIEFSIDSFLASMDLIEWYRLDDYEEYYYDNFGCGDFNCKCRDRYNKAIDYNAYGTRYIRME